MTADMGKAKVTVELCRTDVQKILFELRKASSVYGNMPGLRASTRCYVINHIIKKLNSKL